jgi:DnaK suppressor protein
MATQGKRHGTRPTNEAMKTHRYDELRGMLEERRRAIVSEMHDKIRDVRVEGSRAPAQGVRDEAESSEAEIQGDIEFALLQMKAEMLRKIDEALERLEDRTYGCCYECGEEIAERRLRALPFAVRCKDCEEIREAAWQRERAVTERRGAV